jgi:hypothetical protein
MRRLRNRRLAQSPLHSQPGRMKVLLGPVALDQRAGDQRPAVDQHEEDQLEGQRTTGGSIIIPSTSAPRRPHHEGGDEDAHGQIVRLLRLRFPRHVDEQAQVLLADVLLHETARRSAGAVERLGDADLVGDIVDAREYRPMTKAVRNKASKMTTEFGGEVAVPSAARSSDSTTTMRVNEVIITRIDGASDSTVSSAIN